MARDAGFDNISIDLMYGIPEQTEKSFARTLSAVSALEPDHISVYALKIEDGTPFAHRRDTLVLPDEDAEYAMYMTAVEYLASRGFVRYEISNFAREDCRSRHNLKYWRCEDYLGFGPAAHSYFCGERFAHSHNIDAYLRGESIIIDNEPIGELEMMNEYVMLGMRLSRGISFFDFFARFGVDFLQKFGKIKKYSPEFVTLDSTGCRFTEKGMLVSNYVLSDVLEFGK
jgi:oxygen-independent coproporphyrinogen-3 oxidase